MVYIKDECFNKKYPNILQKSGILLYIDTFPWHMNDNRTRRGIKISPFTTGNTVEVLINMRHIDILKIIILFLFENLFIFLFLPNSLPLLSVVKSFE